MKKYLKILVCLGMSLILAAVCLCALAEGEWVCESCGLSGNTGNFCTSCGAARPVLAWNCLNCGQSGNTGNFCSNCGAAKGAVAVNDQLEQIPGQAECVKVRIQETTASAYISSNRDPVLWHPAKATDGNESTCWQFSAKKSGALGNTWLEMRLASPQTVDALWIKNGFWAYGSSGKDQYVINARPRGIRAEVLTSGSSAYTRVMEYTLEDDPGRSGWQQFYLGRHENVTAVRLWILSAYPGTEFPNDVCLSEVMLVQFAPAATALPPQASGETIVYESPRSAASAKLLMRLATRSGPATEYDEPGTFFSDTWKNQVVQVRGRAWDGNIWWVLIDFSSGGSRYRVWTGLKRVDVDINALPDIYATGQGTVSATDTWRGPGSNYAKGPRITHWQDVEAFGRENGYVEIEYRDDEKNRVYRCWVPAGAASIDWNTGNDANR